MYYYDKSGKKVKKSSFSNVKEGFGFYGSSKATASGESTGMSKTQIALIVLGLLVALGVVIFAVRYSRKSSVKMGKPRYGYKFVR